MDKLVARKEVLKTLKVHYQTLNNMVKRKDIEVIRIGRKFFYNLDKYLRVNGMQIANKRKICYCRVSSPKQKEDLNRQVEYMSNKFPTYEIIKDIGSGLNFERKGLQIILDIAIKGELGELVIAYKDRLARIGYELIENIIKKYSNGQIIVVEKTEEETPDEEMAKDIVSIMNVYVAKRNGLRKYKTLMRDEIINKKPLK